MTVQWAEVTSAGDEDDGKFRIQGIAKCDNCRRTSMGVSLAPAYTSKIAVGTRFERTDDSTFEWFPRAGVSTDFPDVPNSIATAAKEAHSTLSIGARMAAILMARTVVEATAKEKGILTGQLWAKIDDLENQGFIRESTRDAAHEIRHLGNDMAHGDIADVPTEDDATDVLTLMDEVLNEVFQGPARAARIKAKRTGPPATTAP